MGYCSKHEQNEQNSETESSTVGIHASLIHLGVQINQNTVMYRNHHIRDEIWRTLFNLVFTFYQKRI